MLPPEERAAFQCRGCNREFGSYHLYESHLGTDEELELGRGLQIMAAKANMQISELPGHFNPRVKKAFLDDSGVWRQHGGIKPVKAENGPETWFPGEENRMALG